MSKPNRILWEVDGEVVASFTDYQRRTVREDFVIKLKPERIIFNDPATIVFWNDGSKTVVKCSEHDTYDKYRGFTMAYLKRVMGSGKKAEQFIEGNGFEESGVSFIQELLDLMAKGKGI